MGALALLLLQSALIAGLLLVTALTVCCEQFGKLQGVNTQFTAATNLGAIDDDAALCLYRVTQEALRNVAKHASASDVTVSVTRDGDVLQLSIIDNGKGFNLSGTRGHGAGLGLISMDERVRLLGGRVAFETRPGGGTRVKVDVPLPVAAV